MNINAKTFGQVLTQLISEKGLSPELICKKMGIKSQTTLSRIMNDKSTVKKVSTFFSDFLQVNPLDLVEFEKDMLREGLIVNKMGLDNYIVAKKMLSFVNQNLAPLPCICKESFGEIDLSVRTLKDFFDTYKKYKKIHLSMLNSIYDGVIDALSYLLSFSDQLDISIEHYISAEKKMSKSISDFILLLSVINNPNYHCYLSPYIRADQFEFINSFNNMTLVLKTDFEDNKYIDILYLNKDNAFTVLSNLNSEETYQFYSNIFNTMTRQHNSIKSDVMYGPGIENYLELSEKWLEYELKYEDIEIKPMFDIKVFPPSIVKKLFNELEKPYEKRKIDKFLEIQEKRFENFASRSKHNIMILTKKGIIDFANNGKTLYHGVGRKGFTKDEVRQILETFILTCDSNPNIHFYLLKNEINYNNFMYHLFTNNFLFINDERQYYNEIKYCCLIKTDYIIEGFEFFVKNELLINYVYSTKESIEFLKEVIANIYD